MGVRSDVRICLACGRVDVAARMLRVEKDVAGHEARHRCRTCAPPELRPADFDTWPADGFSRQLGGAARIVVFYHALWCDASRSAWDLVVEADEESSVSVVAADLSHPLDPRWDMQGVRVLPTLAYYEMGEELERCEASPGYGLDEREVRTFFASVEDLQEDLLTPRRRRRRLNSRKPSRG